MYVRLSGKRKKSLSEHEALLHATQQWMQDACHKLQSGEHLASHNLTIYRYICMATLMISHQRSEKAVSDFKVSSISLIFNNVLMLKPLLICLQLKVPYIKSCACPCIQIPLLSQVTDWNDRIGVSDGVSIGFKDGPEACTLTKEEERVNSQF